MALQIKWTANALEDYEKIVGYLIQEWSAQIAEKFIEIIEARLETLSNYPYLGLASEKEPSIRSISLTKHNRLYYRMTASAIEVLDIFDTRQSPDKNRHT